MNADSSSDRDRAALGARPAAGVTPAAAGAPASSSMSSSSDPPETIRGTALDGGASDAGDAGEASDDAAADVVLGSRDSDARLGVLELLSAASRTARRSGWKSSIDANARSTSSPATEIRRRGAMRAT